MYDAEERIETNAASVRSLVPTKKFDETKNRMRSLSYSEDGKWLIVSGEDVVFLYDLHDGVKTKNIECKKYGVGEVLYLDTDQCLHSSIAKDDNKDLDENAVRLLNMNTKSYVRYFRGHTKEVVCLTKNPMDEESFLTTSRDMTLRLWDKRANDVAGYLIVNHVPLIAYDPEGLLFAMATESEKIRLFDVRSFDVGPFKVLRDERIDDEEWISIEFSACGRFLLISTKSGSVKWIDTFGEKNAPPIHTFTGHSNPNNLALKATVTRDSKFVMVGSADSKVYIYSTETGDVVDRLPTTSNTPCHVVAFNPQQFLMTSLSREIILWAPNEDFRPSG